ncbi:MAG: glutamate--tRNA ligase [Clostridia bacterium]|nr:glutamate--tRNA ligase [Clostridia bacterium]MDE7328917.1 glutamate--tRNA ligase [Clostridia bacterium]
MEKVRTRFAPSPTGFMHIGNLRTCLYAYLYAKKRGGTFVLRIEDTDQERYVEGAVDVIYNTLEKAGINHDEGPDKDGGYGPYIQSERKSLYLDYAKELVDKGGAYYCFCSKERLDGLKDGNGVAKYDKHCLSLSKAEVEKRLAAGEQYVIRQNVPTSGVSEYEDMVFGHIAVPNEDMEDNILIKSDGMPTYNFANVVDDHLMAINYVIRGVEYLSSTPKYNLMYDSFGWERPRYMHLSPIMKDAQRKLSKRYGDANFEDFLDKGYLPKAIVNYIALLGWSPKGNEEKLTMEQLIEQFDVDGISKSPSIFDEAKMRWLNGEYIKQMSVDEFVEVAKPFFEKSKVKDKYDYKALAKLLIPRVEILSEIPEKVDFLEEFGKYDTAMFEHKKMKITKELAYGNLLAIRQDFESEDDWRDENLKQRGMALAEKLGCKSGQIFLPLRLALTGAATTPGGATEMAELLGKKESMARLDFSIELLKNEL